MKLESTKNNNYKKIYDQNSEGRSNKLYIQN